MIVACSVHDVFVGSSVDDVYLLSSKSAKHSLSQNMPIERSALFLIQVKCVHVVIRWGEFPEELKLCGSNR